ncbi:MAG: polysaccharide pyruvyl transferase CsaB [Capsulimonadales bacterium]|nr:polysaccharide pyruvyl transferase CsaB [Capsulimonadales bacterium]
MSRTSRPALRAAILGYYGFGNLGDEAVLAGIRRALGHHFDLDLLVLTNDPEGTPLLHPGVRAVSRWQWRAVADSLRDTELFVLGGGSLLQDATSVKSVLWYVLMALIARRRARRVLWWGQGVGPLNHPLSRQAVRLIGNQADAITVRDENSARLLKEIGVNRSIYAVADPAFALEPDSGADNPSPAVWFALRHWKEDIVGRVLAGDALKLTSARPEEALALPMHLPEDAEYMERVLPGTPQERWQNGNGRIERTLSRVAGARLMVAMRLHALIFAARCGVPFVAISYDPKVDALARDAGQEDCLLSLNNLTAEEIVETMRRTLETAEGRRTRLREFAADRREKANEPARIAAGL